jgi:hypothetical protein
MAGATAAIIGGVLAAGGSIAAASLAGGDVNGASFAQRDLYKEITDTIQARRETAADELGLHTTYDPQYAALQRQMAGEMLFGTPAGERVRNVWSTEWYQPTESIKWYEGTRLMDPLKSETDAQMVKYLNSMMDAGQTVPGQYRREVNESEGYFRPVARQERYYGEAEEGLLDLYQRANPIITQLENESRRQSREAELADVEALGPRYVQALRGVNPEQTALRDELYGQVRSDLEAGGGLTPSDRRMLTQELRAAQSARGLGTGTGDMATEAIYAAQGATARRQQRQQAAQGMIALDQALYGDPYLAITGRQSGSNASTQAALQQGNAMLGQTQFANFDPYNGYAADLYNTNANATASMAIGNANASAAQSAGYLGLGGSLFSGLMNYAAAKKS